MIRSSRNKQARKQESDQARQQARAHARVAHASLLNKRSLNRITMSLDRMVRGSEMQNEMQTILLHHLETIHGHEGKWRRGKRRTN